MKSLSDFNLEEMFKDYLKENMGEENALNFIIVDPIQYEIGFREFEDNIKFNLEEVENMEQISNHWTQINLYKYGNEEALFQEYEVVLYSKKRNEIINELSIGEEACSFETLKEAQDFFKYVKKTIKSIEKKIEGKYWDEKINNNKRVSDIIEDNLNNLIQKFEEGIVPSQKKRKKVRTI